jgi:putative redox protein
VKVVTVAWKPEPSTFVAQGARPEHAITLAAPRERVHGQAPGLTAMSATDAFLAGLAGCTAWDVVEILRKQRQDLRGLMVVVAAEQEPDPPWPFTRIVLTYTVTGKSLKREAVEKAVKLSSDRYCSVKATLRPETVVETVIEVLEADED